jgi:hypothetical protein
MDYVTFPIAMTPRSLAILLIAVLGSTPQFNMNACSVVMGYIRPTNYELVKETDVIVLANATSFEKKGKLPRGKSFGTFKFRVLENIKGECKAQFISLEGDDDIRSWGDPNNFAFTQGDYGPCNATDYKLKANYVLFLRNWKEHWIIAGAPFTRVNVLVEGTNAPWTEAVRLYAQVAKLNDYEKEKVALRELRSRALANDPHVPGPLAVDIDRHFSEPTPAKSFSDLRALYEKSANPDTREYVLWACARGQKPEAKDFFESLLRSGEWTNFLSPVCRYVDQVKLRGFHDTFASTLSTNQNAYERRMLLFALTGSAEDSEQLLMQKIMESVSGEELVIVAKWFVDHPSPAAIKYISIVASKNYEEQVQLTLALAGMGDTNVLNWARKFVMKSSEKDWLGYYVFAQSPLPAADVLARAVIKGKDSEALVWLVQGYKDSKRADRLERIRDVMAIKSKSRKLIYWLRRTLDDWAYDGDKEAQSLVSQLPDVGPE